MARPLRSSTAACHRVTLRLTASELAQLTAAAGARDVSASALVRLALAAFWSSPEPTAPPAPAATPQLVAELPGSPVSVTMMVTQPLALPAPPATSSPTTPLEQGPQITCPPPVARPALPAAPALSPAARLAALEKELLSLGRRS